MAPKPSPRLQNASTKGKSELEAIKAEQDAKAMPPPPVPHQMSILEPEMNALSGCLKNAAVKTGEILRFYVDTQKLGIRKHASSPPISLQVALGRELELYDQICESVESHLLRAISVLQRDLQQEQQRIKDAEAAANAMRKSPSPIPASTDIPMDSEPEATQTNEVSSNPSQSPVQGSILSGRRQSTISMSSLHRPALPPKLDLSATALRLSTDDPTSFLTSGGRLPSPVTLAPKSARPTDYSDLMAAFGGTGDSSSNPVDIDLTIPESDTSGNLHLHLNDSIGDSADKPIELDMGSIEGIDMPMDLFGDSDETASNNRGDVENLFSPVEGPEDSNAAQNKTDTSFLSSLGVTANTNNDLFSSLQNNDSLQLPTQTTSDQNAPSPGSLLATLSHGMQSGGQASSEGVSNSSVFDLNMLFTGGDNASGMNLEQLWNLGGSAEPPNDVGSKNTS
ncbi:hypothetical protein VNI00_014388 [Paramarasmius palmivorus]|uniref:Uncharacterized protein n=1 Tax=Paramarasmius palmivorus TaxID=297713 RepID=A0AAW0BQR4_9AGAR